MAHYAISFEIRDSRHSQHIRAKREGMGAARLLDALWVLTSPKSRDGSDLNKSGPCGSLPIINPPNLYTAGQQVTVAWKETVNHPGCFVFDWSKDNNATFTLCPRKRSST